MFSSVIISKAVNTTKISIVIPQIIFTVVKKRFRIFVSRKCRLRKNAVIAKMALTIKTIMNNVPTGFPSARHLKVPPAKFHIGIKYKKPKQSTK